MFNKKIRNSTSKKLLLRENREDIEKWLKKDNRILIFTGLKRSGKSTLLKQIMQDHEKYWYVNFEEERFIDFKAQNFERLHEFLIEIYGSSIFFLMKLKI